MTCTPPEPQACVSHAAGCRPLTAASICPGRELLLDYGPEYWSAALDAADGAQAPPPPLVQETADSELEDHEPLDREAVSVHARAAGQSWEWVEPGRGAECLAAGASVDFPGTVYQHTPPLELQQLRAAIASWLQGRAQTNAVEVGRLLCPEHPAVRHGGEPAFGLFAAEDLAAGCVVCEYQGELLTSAAGCDRAPQPHSLPVVTAAYGRADTVLKWRQRCAMPRRSGWRTYFHSRR